MQEQTPTTPMPEADPFAIGWREVPRPRPDGTVEYERVPLTLEDALHPREGDVMLETLRHVIDRCYLREVLSLRIPNDPEGIVTSDQLIDWGVPGMRAHAPDVALIVGMHEPFDLTRGQLDLLPSGGRCELVLEVASKSTRSNDIVEKVNHYYQAKIPLYAIIDLPGAKAARHVVGYEWTPSGYARMPVDDRGRVWLEPVRLWLGVKDDRAVCWDGDTDAELGDYAAAVAAVEAADRRYAEQQQAIEETIDRAQAAERAVLAEKSRREAAEEEAAEEQARREAAEEETRRMTERVRELEELLRRLQAG